jgi:hypothetical protein
MMPGKLTISSLLDLVNSRMTNDQVTIIYLSCHLIFSFARLSMTSRRTMRARASLPAAIRHPRLPATRGHNN